ncbi:MAG: TetR/AcrR family transcriptional regulator [Oscillospiraceae bacterium]|nr:TetR/AcrR family transcriptional regulator [Oscillospiraceae bacterium]
MNKSESKYFNTAVKFDKALLSLLEKKPFEYITISEICEKAGVNRSTFYLHYENTRDLLKETISYILDNFTSYFDVNAENITSKFTNCDLSELNYINEKYLHPYLLFVKENRRIFFAVLSRPITFDSNIIFQRLFDNIFSPILDRFHYPRDEQNYVMMFYLNGITAIITEWLKDDCKKSIEEISIIIRYCIFGREC